MTLIYAHLAPDFLQAEIARMSFATAPAADVVSLDAQRGRLAGSGHGEALEPYARAAREGEKPGNQE